MDIKELTDWDWLEEKDLSESCKNLSEVIGFKSTVILMQKLPIKGVYIPSAEGIEKTQVARDIGIDKATKLANSYHGETLVLPKITALTNARDRRLRIEAKGSLNESKSKTEYYAKIAERENLSIPRVREILNYR